MSFRILRFLYHFAVYAVGTLVLTAAVLVSLIRLVLPDIGIYRSEVEAWVSHYMGYPVVIRSLNATWYGWIPHLHLTNVDLLNKAGTQAITHFKSAEIRIDPLATLLARRFIPRQLTVSGFDLTVARLESGAIMVEGINIGDPKGVADPGNELAEWLFSQDTIEIRNATVEWIDSLHEQEPIMLTDVALTLRTDDDRIQVEGSTALPTVYGNRMDFAFDATGDLMTSQWGGELYLHASDINPDHWYRKYRPLNMDIAGGSADIRVWSRWEGAKLFSLQGELQYQDFAALIGDASLRVEELGYRFIAERTPQGGWRLQMRLRDLMTENGLWPEANVVIYAEPVADQSTLRYSIGFDYLKLDDLTPIISGLVFVPDSLRASIAGLGITGEVIDGRLEIDPLAEAPDQLTYDLRFEHLATKNGRRLPRLSNGSGHVYGSLRNGGIRFDGDTAELEAATLKLGRLPMEALAGAIQWTRDTEGLVVHSDGLRFKTPDFSGQLAGTVVIPAGGPAAADLVAEIGEADVEKLSEYLPELPNFKFKNWMERAVVSGRLLSAHGLLHGRFSDFPFSGNTGRFQVIANVENVVLDYSDKWPPVDNLSAEIGIDGNSMLANVHGGNVFSARILDAAVGIDDILDPEKTVEISGRIAGATSDLNLFIDQSPLTRRAILRRIRDSLSGGDMELELSLGIPVPAAGRTADVGGILRLDGATLTAGTGNFTLSDLSGQVEFTRTSAAAEGMNAVFYGQPVQVAVSGSPGAADDPPAMTVRGAADREFIVARVFDFFPSLKTPRDSLLEHLGGNADWELRVEIGAADESGNSGNRIEIASDLRGLRIELPVPLGKTAHEAVPLRITREFRGGGPGDVALQYGSVLSGGIAMEPGGGRSVRGVALHFGNTDFIPQSEDGLKLSGYIDALPVMDWWNVLRASASTVDADGDFWGPVDAELQVGNLLLFGRSFTGVDITGERSANAWLVHLDGADVAGDVELPARLDADAEITLGLKRLHLSRLEARDEEDRLNPRTVPKLNVDIEEFAYDGRDLGQVTLNTYPVVDGLAIEQFQFHKPDLLISGNGTWTRVGTEDQSSFDIALLAGQFDSMLKTFGYEVTAIDKGETELDIDATWAGTPMEFSLSELSGSLAMKIRKGQLLDINPKAGRLFGLLSIQTLPRRLSLDFTDLFGKGLAFDLIEGNFQLANGNAYTNDLFLRGPSANVAVTGRTGLAEKDYDQLVTVTPQIADTLPVASALFGPVGIGVGAVLYLAGEMFESIHDKIDTLLNYQYTITGSWDEPVIEKYESREPVSG